MSSSMMDTPSPHPDPNRSRLPTLFEVLSRQTSPPVDLFSFYIYMRDQQRSVDYLDFWLDVSQHMSLCRHYVRELRRSVLVETPDMEKQGSKRSSYILDHMGEINDPSGPSQNLHGDEKLRDQHLSAYLRQENNNNGTNHSPHSSIGSQQSRLRESGDRPSGGTDRERPPRPSFMTNGSPGRTNSNSPAHTVARADIRASAEKILYTFLLPGSEREIILPQGILTDITTSIEEEGRDDPEVFDAAKDYTFQAMERDAFPGFLRAKALGNLVPPSSFLRLCIGLLGMFGGFWAGFACILLDKPKHIRCWLILPFTIGVYALSSQQYSIDPVLALAGLSEYTFMNWARIREPYIRKLMNKRAIMVLLFTVLIGVALIVLFIFVPGHRL
ncbi:Bud site selection protein, Revert to axial protein 1 [Lecanora helva]